VNPFTLTDSAENTLSFLVDGTVDKEAYDGFVRAHIERPLDGVLTFPMSSFIPRANERAVSRLVEWLFQQQPPAGQRSLVLAINGQTAVGKTLLAEGVRGRVTASGRTCSVVETDAFLKQSRRERLACGVTGLEDAAYELDALQEAVFGLSQGRGSVVATYSHEAGERSTGRNVEPADIIVVDGLMSTHPKLKWNVSIWISHEGDLHRTKRIERDVRYRNYNRKAALKNWASHENAWPRFENLYRPSSPTRTIRVNKSGMWLLAMAAT
jgi:uridine kinase